MVVQLIVGPMYAGKTTKLFESQELYGGLIIDFCEGEPNRGVVKNHKEESRECIRTPRLSYLTRPEFIADLTKSVNIYIKFQISQTVPEQERRKQKPRTMIKRQITKLKSQL